jgi:hypothetical protein
MFPRTIAGALGLDPDHLSQDPAGARGVEGEGFPTWSATQSISGQIIRTDPQTGNQEPWGPSFSMDPAFAEKDVFLLGRADFFPIYSIGFEQDVSGPLLRISF